MTSNTSDNADDAENHRVKLEHRIGELEDQAAIDKAMIAYLHDEVDHEQLQVEHLEAALTSARRIGAAIGIVMAARRTTEASAFAMLSRISQAQNRKLREVADDIVPTGDVSL